MTSVGTHSDGSVLLIGLEIRSAIGKNQKPGPESTGRSSPPRHWPVPRNRPLPLNAATQPRKGPPPRAPVDDTRRRGPRGSDHAGRYDGTSVICDRHCLTRTPWEGWPPEIVPDTFFAHGERQQHALRRQAHDLRWLRAGGKPAGVTGSRVGLQGTGSGSLSERLDK